MVPSSVFLQNYVMQMYGVEIESDYSRSLYLILHPGKHNVD